MKKLTESILKAFQDQDVAYVRMIREYSTVKDSNPDAKAKALKYAEDMKNLVYDTVLQLVEAEKKTVSDQLQRKSKTPKDTNEALLFAMERLTAIEMIKSEIAGSTDYRALIDKYRDSEYAADFKILFQPVIKGKIDNNDPGAISLVSYLDSELSREPREIEELTRTGEDIHSILFFNQQTMPMGVHPNDDERFLIGNYQSRNILKDISAASVEFNPLNERLDPIIVTEKTGGRYYKTIKYEYEW